MLEKLLNITKEQWKSITVWFGADPSPTPGMQEFYQGGAGCEDWYPLCYG